MCLGGRSHLSGSHGARDYTPPSRLGDQRRGSRPPGGTYRATAHHAPSREPGIRAGAVLRPCRTAVPLKVILGSGGGPQTMARRMTSTRGLQSPRSRSARWDTLLYPIVIARTVSGPTTVQILSKCKSIIVRNLSGLGYDPPTTHKLQGARDLRLETAEGESSCDTTHTSNFQLKDPPLHHARLVVPTVVLALWIKQR